MKVFVIGGTGQVGGQVASGLAGKGADVRVLTRDPRRAAELPSSQTGVVGDLLDVELLRAEMRTADGIFIMSPPTEMIAYAGLNVLALVKEANLKKVVMMTGQDCSLHLSAGHIGSLVPLEQELARSELNYTLLNPNYFYQNDERQAFNLLKEAVYGSPIGDVGMSRCDARDIADAALEAFDRPIGARRIRVCGPEVLNGESVAAHWSLALGKTIKYAGHSDMAEFERQCVKSGVAPHWALDIRIMYESFQRFGLVASKADVDRISEFLGRPPRTFANFAAETAAKWAR